MRTIRLLNTVYLLLFAGLLRAQFTGMSLLPVNILPDTLYAGLQYNIYARLQNADSLNFTGGVQFGARNNQFLLPQSAELLAQPPYVSNTLQLVADEQVPAFFRISIDPDYFTTPGPETIVIWPISNKPVKDSLIIPFILAGTFTDVNELQLGKPHCYEAMQRLKISCIREDWRITLYNVQGLTVKQETYTGEGLDISALPPGLYMVLIEDLQGGSVILKHRH